MSLNPVIADVTARIVARSKDSRAAYLANMDRAIENQPGRAKLSCANWAHAFAASPGVDKLRALDPNAPNIGIVSAYNDMLSAHQPLEAYPALIKDAARDVGATAQFAGGVPAMCDGVTQGRPGMELSLFSRDVIAMATAVALTHDAFDSALYLGVCDKIVPGLVIGALTFSHLPALFVPAGPMTSGLPNSEKARIRALYAEGKVGREELLAAESASYHGPGTCTFYGTANTNQMLMELMGFHLPGSAFVHPNTPLREALVKESARRVAAVTNKGNEFIPVGRMIDEKSFVNGVVGLMATGGSTNLALHIIAMAAAAGVQLTLEDLDDISKATPLLARVYPNGSADVNHFQAAGGMAFVIRELLKAGLVHEDVQTIAGAGLSLYAKEPVLEDGMLTWRDGAHESLDPAIVRPVSDPFSKEGGLRLMAGNLGRGVMKISAVKPEHHVIEAPCAVFQEQEDFIAAFKRGELDRDVVVVVRFQGPSANGMPELHNLSPSISVLLDRGHKVALVTDGRMSGASGKTPAAIHVTPEAAKGGPLAYVQDGDVIRVNAETGELKIMVDEATLLARTPANVPASKPGFGRELFGWMRSGVGAADAGASVFA
ncbi:phosphogluconate dehydratase [Caulobacter vibrioides]|uniref:Phosphogluconate dehydratase n=2 Tax=Caulobacter vibrioides TaxID=155892 RepID=Q9A6N2_CAUVC|nr:phosphogluconate dehydratase [Caulobacter vibrioides]YP_002517507.1 phosphogluconate dehydratase [Caulobacter vibrioides NA1000]AAK24028.1 phosphogluconate dehydratase [Caulobacter vibrioides CB15]ACL95599.1 phosphogluconate dehydratase [Caulobacter vibrioides NA1000]ATC28924.1 phosphogluconate dehydratase [Caulobacter vibrioides]QXZ50437.1 phosphogluconate dehydratase [Caulobacter vibrioides]